MPKSQSLVRRSPQLPPRHRWPAAVTDAVFAVGSLAYWCAQPAPRANVQVIACSDGRSEAGLMLLVAALLAAVGAARRLAGWISWGQVAVRSRCRQRSRRP